MIPAINALPSLDRRGAAGAPHAAGRACYSEPNPTSIPASHSVKLGASGLRLRGAFSLSGSPVAAPDQRQWQYAQKLSRRLFRHPQHAMSAASGEHAQHKLPVLILTAAAYRQNIVHCAAHIHSLPLGGAA